METSKAITFVIKKKKLNFNHFFCRMEIHKVQPIIINGEV